LLFELLHAHLQSGGRPPFLAEDLGLPAVQQRGVPDAEVLSNRGSGMAVEQHLNSFLLEFIRVDAPLELLRFVGLHGRLLGCWIRVNLSSRSVHKTPYTSSVPIFSLAMKASISHGFR